MRTEEKPGRTEAARRIRKMRSFCKSEEGSGQENKWRRRQRMKKELSRTTLRRTTTTNF